jgi:hypothetical protein
MDRNGNQHPRERKTPSAIGKALRKCDHHARRLAAGSRHGPKGRMGCATLPKI